MDSKKTPLAVAVFMVIIYIVCLLGVLMFPGFSKTLTRSWFHGPDLTLVWNTSTLTWGNVVIGLVSVFIGVYLATWIFIKLHKAMVK